MRKNSAYKEWFIWGLPVKWLCFNEPFSHSFTATVVAIFSSPAVGMQEALLPSQAAAQGQ